MLTWGSAWTVHYTTRDLADPEEVPAWLRGAPDGIRAFLNETGVPDGLPFLLSPRFEYDTGLNSYFHRPVLLDAPWNTNANRARALAGFLTFLERSRGGRSWRDAVEEDHLARFGGKVVLDDNRLRRLMTRHDPAVYPGEYVTCVHDHSKALCEKARSRRSEGLPDHGGCKPLACRNVALTPGNVASWHEEIDKITERLAARPPLPPLLRRRLEDRRTEITAFLDRASAAGTSS